MRRWRGELAPMSKQIHILGIVVLLALIASGCTNKGWEIVYAPQTGAPSGSVAWASQPMRSVTVFELADERPDKVNVGGEYNKFGTMVERYQSSKPVPQLITEAVIRNLESQGLTVLRSSGWTGDPRSLPDIVTDLALGGKIKVFWVERQPAGLYLPNAGWLGENTSSQASVAITIVAPDGAVLWEGDLVGIDTYRTSFGSSTPKKMLEKALAEAIDQLASNPQIEKHWYRPTVGDSTGYAPLVSLRF